ncbi:MAG: hypothetical protein PQJ61_04950 [Spirochaetales bacterium]|uniref:Uncharacterized protein n=1 Tax=Candidatus Thalassospirochaeta sargassi TaxID=3119039 RepID=A0AAJ1IEU1_9SPIO|nr:hypothetical protein [Spirochaetales bacterium]
MKRTGVLKIIHDTAFPVNKLVIHPNTGFDLGFMQLKYVPQLCINSGVEEFKTGCSEVFCNVDLMLLNECGADKLEMSQKLWLKIGMPDKALLVFDEETNRLLIAC